MRPDVAPAV